jgi:hypothetical protein
MAAAAPDAGPRRWPAGLAWGLWALTLLGLVATAWLDRRLRQAGWAELAALPASGIPLAVAAVSAVTVGAVLAGRRPAHPVGWLLVGLGLTAGAQSLTFSATRYGLVARPGSLPGVAYLAGLNNALALAWISCAGFVLLLTPTGRPPSPRWRWWARVAAAAALLWLAGSVVDPAPLRPEFPRSATRWPSRPCPARWTGSGWPAWWSWSRCRWRRGRWCCGSAGPGAANASSCAGWPGGGPGRGGAAGRPGRPVRQGRLHPAQPEPRGQRGPAAAGHRGGHPALPPLRPGPHRQPHPGLRAAHHPARLGYTTVVLGLGRLLPQRSSLTVAAATLAVAAAFQPVRRRIQAAVDRRFNRRRHDAARTIEGFSHRLRDQLDLDTLTSELLTVVDQTIQPTRASLWLRPQDPRRSP